MIEMKQFDLVSNYNIFVRVYCTCPYICLIALEYDFFGRGCVMHGCFLFELLTIIEDIDK